MNQNKDKFTCIDVHIVKNCILVIMGSDLGILYFVSLENTKINVEIKQNNINQINSVKVLHEKNILITTSHDGRINIYNLMDYSLIKIVLDELTNYLPFFFTGIYEKDYIITSKPNKKIYFVETKDW